MFDIHCGVYSKRTAVALFETTVMWHMESWAASTDCVWKDHVVSTEG